MCGIEPHDDGDESNPNRNSVLYNAMIHPLIRLSIKGALWYQGKKTSRHSGPFSFLQIIFGIFKILFKGESNGGYNRDQYQCTFPAMISEWRKLWSTYTPTSGSFPFGFMQLGPWDSDNKSPGFPVIRWHQTADYGFVPNEIMEVNKY